MFSQNFHSQILVGGTATKTATLATDRVTAMAAGEIGCFTPGGFLYTEATADADDPFVITLKRSDGTFQSTGVLTKSMVKSVTLKTAVADAEQIDYVGYNGSSGSITVANDEFYRIRIWLREGHQNNIHGTEYEKHAIYESDATATEAEIALGLVANGNANMSREPKNSSGNPFIKFKAVCSVALANDYVFDNSGFDVTVVKGSKIAYVAAATPTYNTGTALAVGDFLRMGDATGADGVVALKSDVYKVVALPTTTTIELDRPVQVTSATYVDNGGRITVIPAASGVAANWGVGITGQPQDFSATSSQGSVLKYQKVAWTTQLNSEAFGSTVITKDTAASLGVGQWEQVTEMEVFMNGNNGEFFRKGQPNLFSWTLQTDSAEGSYDLIILEIDETATSLVQSHHGLKQVIIAIPNTTPDYALSGTADDFTDTLEDLLIGVPVYNGTKNGTALAAADLNI